VKQRSELGVERPDKAHGLGGFQTSERFTRPTQPPTESAPADSCRDCRRLPPR
jgi:hypothetical protein